MQNRKMIMFVLCVFLLSSTIGLSTAAVEEYKQKPFSQAKDSIQFRSDVNLKSVNVEKHADKIVISSSEHKETSIKIKKSDIEALGTFQGALRVTHYNDAGIQDWCRVIYPKEESGYFEIPVEFSTVDVAIERTRVLNWDMESWASASSINDWVVSAGTVTRTDAIKYTGTYCTKIERADGSAYMDQQFGVTANMPVNISCYTWTTSQSALQYAIYNSGGTELATGTINSATTGSWELLQRTVNVPSTAASMAVRLVAWNQGSPAYFDSVRVTQSTNTVSADETYGGGWADTSFQYYKYPHYTMVIYEFSESASMANQGDYTVKIDGSTTTDVYKIGNEYWIWASMPDSAWHTIEIHQAYSAPPLMLTPANGSTITRAFPPLYADQKFTWENTGAICEIQIAEDTAFSNLIYTSQTTAASATVSLAQGTYYWRVRSWDSITNDFGAYPDSYYVTIVASAASITGTGIHGVVYESKGIGNYQAIPGALVTLYNDTYSITKTTGSDGYYQCLGLTNGTYYVIAQAGNFKDSNIAAANVTAGQVIVQNIAIQPETSYFAPHDVQFTFYQHWYSLVPMSGVSYSIYENSNTVALQSGTVDSTGSFAVEDVNQGIKYRIVATHTENGVTRTLTKYIYPVDASYRLFFSQSETADTAGFAEAVNITVSKAAINTTAANITVAWNDTTNRLHSVTSVLSYNGTTLDTKSNANSTAQVTFIAYDYTGKSYIIDSTFDHPDFGTVVRKFSVTFTGSNIPFAGSILLGYLAVFILLIVATQFGKLEHATGSIAFVALAWVFFFLGMFDGFGKNTAIELGLTVATLYAIMVYVISRKEGGA